MLILILLEKGSNRIKSQQIWGGGWVDGGWVGKDLLLTLLRVAICVAEPRVCVAGKYNSEQECSCISRFQDSRIRKTFMHLARGWGFSVVIGQIRPPIFFSSVLLMPCSPFPSFHLFLPLFYLYIVLLLIFLPSSSPSPFITSPPLRLLSPW